MLIILNREKQK